MAGQKNVFIVGPGFIGWNVVDLLVGEGYKVQGLVRREEHANGIRASAATAVLGDLNDKKLIAAQTLEHDIIFHTATADHLPSVEAILDGIRERIKQGKPTTFIHTSGTSILDDNAHGSAKSDKVYHDNVRSEVDSVPDSAPHREIDLAILKAQREFGDKAKMVIMTPPLIYGFNPNHGRLTAQIPTLTRFALKHGFSGYVGNGLSVESNIHVKDLARGYIMLLHHMEASSPATFLENPYYFCETSGDQEPSWRDVAAEIGKSLHAAGKLQDPTPKTVPESLYGDLFGEHTGAFLGLNSRSRAVRLRELGWQPREKSWKESYIQDELPEILKEETGSFKGYEGCLPASK